MSPAVNRRDDLDALAGAGDGDVQAAPAAGLVERPEVQRELARFVVGRTRC